MDSAHYTDKTHSSNFISSTPKLTCNKNRVLDLDSTKSRSSNEQHKDENKKSSNDFNGISPIYNDEHLRAVNNIPMTKHNDECSFGDCGNITEEFYSIRYPDTFSKRSKYLNQSSGKPPENVPNTLRGNIANNVESRLIESYVSSKTLKKECDMSQNCNEFFFKSSSSDSSLVKKDNNGFSVVFSSSQLSSSTESDDASILRPDQLTLSDDMVSFENDTGILREYPIFEDLSQVIINNNDMDNGTFLIDTSNFNTLKKEITEEADLLNSVNKTKSETSTKLEIYKNENIEDSSSDSSANIDPSKKYDWIYSKCKDFETSFESTSASDYSSSNLQLLTTIIEDSAEYNITVKTEIMDKSENIGKKHTAECFTGEVENYHTKTLDCDHTKTPNTTKDNPSPIYPYESSNLLSFGDSKRVNIIPEAPKYYIIESHLQNKKEHSKDICLNPNFYQNNLVEKDQNNYCLIINENKDNLIQSAIKNDAGILEEQSDPNAFNSNAQKSSCARITPEEKVKTNLLMTEVNVKIDEECAMNCETEINPENLKSDNLSDESFMDTSHSLNIYRKEAKSPNYMLDFRSLQEFFNIDELLVKAVIHALINFQSSKGATVSQILRFMIQNKTVKVHSKLDQNVRKFLEIASEMGFVKLEVKAKSFPVSEGKARVEKTGSLKNKRKKDGGYLMKNTNKARKSVKSLNLETKKQLSIPDGNEVTPPGMIARKLRSRTILIKQNE